MDAILTSHIIAWVILVVCCLVGLVGVIIPGVPGMVLIFLGAALHKYLIPDSLSWWVLAIVFAGVLISMAIDLLGTVAGARWGGATRWGLAGAGVGALVGLFFGLIGLIVGPLLGAFGGELLSARRTLGEAAQAGIGAGLGIAVSTVLRVLLAVTTVTLIFLDSLIL